MPYFIRTHPDAILIDRMKQLAALHYEEAHGHAPTTTVVDEQDETIICAGDYTECFTFWEFIGD